MEDFDIKRRLVNGMLNLVLGALAAWMANYLTNKILGTPPEQNKLLG
jgi:hypothetical protein